MANQKLQAVHKTQAGSWLLLMSGVLAGCAGLAVAGWAGQAAPPPAAQQPPKQVGETNPKAAPAPTKMKTAKTPPRAQTGPGHAIRPAPPKMATAKIPPRAQTGPRHAAKPAAAREAAQAPKESVKALPPITARRDPFRLPVVMMGGASGAAGGPIGLPPPPGNRGLVISQLQLEGIVRLDTTNTMIAVVTNYRKLAYFLKPDDVLYDGVVSKITTDAVYFKENHLDPNGQVMTVDVVKRLSPAPGEGK